jgi:hypothetical protein
MAGAHMRHHDMVAVCAMLRSGSGDPQTHPVDLCTSVVAWPACTAAVYGRYVALYGAALVG